MTRRLPTIFGLATIGALVLALGAATLAFTDDGRGLRPSSVRLNDGRVVQCVAQQRALACDFAHPTPGLP